MSDYPTWHQHPYTAEIFPHSPNNTKQFMVALHADGVPLADAMMEYGVLTSLNVTSPQAKADAARALLTSLEFFRQKGYFGHINISKYAEDQLHKYI